VVQGTYWLCLCFGCPIFLLFNILDKAGNQLSFCFWIYACLEPISSITTHLASNGALATCLNEVNKRSHLLSTASRRKQNQQTFSKPWPWTLKLTLWLGISSQIGIQLSSMWIAWANYGFNCAKFSRGLFSQCLEGKKTEEPNEYQPGVNKPNISFKLSGVKVTIFKAMLSTTGECHSPSSSPSYNLWSPKNNSDLLQPLTGR